MSHDEALFVDVVKEMIATFKGIHRVSITLCLIVSVAIVLVIVTATLAVKSDNTRTELRLSAQQLELAKQFRKLADKLSIRLEQHQTIVVPQHAHEDINALQLNATEELGHNER